MKPINYAMALWATFYLRKVIPTFDPKRAALYRMYLDGYLKLNSLSHGAHVSFEYKYVSLHCNIIQTDNVYLTQGEITFNASDRKISDVVGFCQGMLQVQEHSKYLASIIGTIPGYKPIAYGPPRPLTPEEVREIGGIISPTSKRAPRASL